MEKNENHPGCWFVECLRDKFLSQHRPKFYESDCNKIKVYLNNVEWDSQRKDTNSKFKKPIWMDQYCVRKVKEKYNAWKSFTSSHSYRDCE